MNIARARRLWKPLLKRNPDLEMAGALVLVPPVRRVVGVLLLDGSSSPEVFYPTWAVMRLCKPVDGIALNWGGPLTGAPGVDYDDFLAWSEERQAAALCEMAERQIELMRPLLDSFSTFLAHVVAIHPGFDPAEKVILDVATGNFDAAREIVRKHGPRWAHDEPKDEWDDRAKRLRLRELCRLIEADDRAGMALLLRQFEVHTTERLRITHRYEPTPFPFELGERIEYGGLEGVHGGRRP